jgi:protein-glutamine gamma-glutamyltransferase
MTVQRLIAVVMILASSVLTAWASDDIAFPAILGMLGLLGTLRRFTWDIRPEKHFITPLLLLLLAVLFALHCRYAHVRADQAAAFAWQTIARYFLASMILILFLRRQGTAEGEKVSTEEGRNVLSSHLLTFSPSASGLPPSLGLFHLASMMAAGQILLLDDQYLAFRLTELSSVTLVILYAVAASSEGGSRTSAVGERFRACRRLLTTDYRLLAGLAALLLVAMNLGWIGGSLLYRHVESINFLPAWLSRGTIALENATTDPVARVGFTTSGTLSTVLAIKEDLDTTPVLSITGGNPGYLRAKAFESYHLGAWHELSSWEGVVPESMPLGGLLGRTSLYRLREAEATREMTIRHESGLGDVMFTALGTCFVEAPFTVVMRNDDDIVKSQVRSRQSYRVGYASSLSGRPPSSLQLYHLKELPKSLAPEIRTKANHLFWPGMTTAQKIDAVTKYFHTNYTYVLGLEVPENQDPLNYFLQKASTGYCEYFASGAAILLRLADVPTRYVTGFLVTERGTDGRSWIARNMDAHAWVEAWDKEQGQWVIVEATTQEALDDASLAGQLARGTGGGRPFLSQLLDALYDYGLLGVVGRLFLSYGLLTGGVLSLVCFAAAWWVAVRRRRHPASLVRRSLSAEVLALHRLLALVDRQAAACGCRRQAGETLHAFAARLTTAGSLLAVAGPPLPAGAGSPPHANGLSDWYLQYARLRYSGVLDPSRLEQLRLAVQKLRGFGAGRKSDKT